MLSALGNASAEEKLYNAKGKRDPFISLTSGSKPSTGASLVGVESADEIVVEGVMCEADPKDSIVMLNGAVLKTGQEMGSVKVISIDQAGVRLSVNGEEVYKQLYQEENQKGTR